MLFISHHPERNCEEKWITLVMKRAFASHGPQMLSQVAKHSTELAALVVEQNVMPTVLQCLTNEDHTHTRLAAASLVQEVSRRTPDLAQVMNSHPLRRDRMLRGRIKPTPTGICRLGCLKTLRLMLRV
jgi:hypothetical protein